MENRGIVGREAKLPRWEAISARPFARDLEDCRRTLWQKRARHGGPKQLSQSFGNQAEGARRGSQADARLKAIARTAEPAA